MLVPSLLKQWKHLEAGLSLSAETLKTLNTHFVKSTKEWEKEDHHAQLNRHTDSTLMDIYDTETIKGMLNEWIILSELCSCIQKLHPMWMFSNNWLWNRAKTSPLMVKHIGLHLASKYRSSSQYIKASHCLLDWCLVLRLGIRYQLQTHGSKITTAEM